MNIFYGRTWAEVNLDFLKKNIEILSKISEGKPITETQADEFAARLLAPACVLWALGVFGADEIAELCEISHKAAEFRAKRMTVLKERNMFLTHPLEKQLFKAFEPWILRQKSNKTLHN